MTDSASIPGPYPGRSRACWSVWPRCPALAIRAAYGPPHRVRRTGVVHGRLARHRPCHRHFSLGGTGSAAGVLLGGALTDGPGWQWVFFVNVPVGLVALAALPALLPRRLPQPARLDLPGVVLVTAGTASLIYGLVRAGDAGWASTTAVLPLVGALVLYAAFAAVERVSRAALMDLRMFTRRLVLVGAFLMLVATALLIGFFLLGSVYLQQQRGYSPLATGLVFLPVAVATGIGARLGSQLVGRIGTLTTAVAGLVVTAAGTLPLVWLPADGSVYARLMPGLVIASFGIGVDFVTAITTALALVAPEEAGLASGVVNTFHEVGGSIAAVLSTVAVSGIEHGAADGFTSAFTLSAITAAASALIALVLVPHSKPQTTGGPHAH
ncbi:MFS transporter [Streptomyces mirabilis]|uniref:MFS transporter n=1 Tax=Streptomyces mirabilis TaxID=68239 RepID=UPI000945B452|nr:MFS transporter [Streptomyces mirabilis]